MSVAYRSADIERIQRAEAQERDYLIALQDMQGWRIYRQRLEAHRRRVEQKVLAGGLTHEEYLRVTGELRGLRFALEYPPDPPKDEV